MSETTLPLTSGTVREGGHTVPVEVECVCKKWANIHRVIPISFFRGWGYPGIKENCFDYAWAQLKLAGYTMMSPGWGSSKKMNPNIYQILLNTPVAGMPSGVQKEQFVAAVSYLKKSIQNNIPVLAGVDDNPKASNTDKITDHFVVIVGMGTDESGSYFIFDDNATGANDSSGVPIGASPLNRLYCKCDEFLLQGKTDPRNGYGKNLIYTVTQVRASRSLK